MKAFCRDCLRDIVGAEACPHCAGRVLAHPELESLTIAHIDCDAFYASIEKRDNPDLRDEPVIVGGRKRGVVLTACYVARKWGVKSAMPMFRALKLCPDAVVIKPRMPVYVAVAREVRSMMREVTPIVEPVSLDEAYLDLAGTERLHALPPAKVLARLARDIEGRVGITVSVGLSCNKFLAKLASDLMKPRGFQVIGKAEAKDFLRDKPVSLLRGAGPVLQARLAKDGFTKIGHLQDTDHRTLKARSGTTGVWLSKLANADAGRLVDPSDDRKTISSETTFERDLAGFEELQRILFRQCERVSARAKETGLGGRTVVLKLKTSGYRIRTRRISLKNPTQLADRMFRAMKSDLRREADGTAFRLLGVGLSHLVEAQECDRTDLVDQGEGRRAAAERAMDKVRAKFGQDSVGSGRSLRR